MKVTLSPTAVLAIAGLAVGGFVLWKARQALPAAANAINPLNHDNIFATGVNSVGGVLFPDPEDPGKNADGSWSLGGWVYDITHADAGKVATGRTPAPAQDNTYGSGMQYDPMGNPTGIIY